MRLAGVVAASAVLLLVLAASPSCHGASSQNITDILAAYPNLTEFNAALTSTGAAAEIDRRRLTSITVLAVDNAVMAQLKAQQLQPKDLEHVIYLHVLLDYFDAAKLASIQGGSAEETSLYQATGKAKASEGMVSVTVSRGGRAAFALSGPSNALPPAIYLKSILEAPYDIAVLQVSAPIWSPAPASAAPRLADLLSKNGCGGFAGLLAASDVAAATFERSAGGLTVFCPANKAVSAFLPRFKNLSAEDQIGLLLYHGVAAHYSAQSLKEINGDVNTLATDGSKGYKFNLTVHADGDTVKLSSSSPSAAKVTKTLVDKAPLAVYLIDAVLLPRELLNNGQGRTAPAPAPASSLAPPPPPPPPPPPAIAPASPPAHAHTTPPDLAPVVAPAIPPTPRRRPAPSPEDDTPAASPNADDNKPPADQKNNGARDTASWSLGTAVATVVPVIVLLLLW